MSRQWRTPEELAAARDVIAAAIEGWAPPAAFAVGISSATSSAETDFPIVNVGEHELAAVIMATVVGHASGTATYELNTAQLRHAISGLEPAEACTVVEHRNLAAWRELLAEAESNPARTLCVVFVGSLGDPVSSEADGSLRSQLPST